MGTAARPSKSIKPHMTPPLVGCLTNGGQPEQTAVALQSIKWIARIGRPGRSMFSTYKEPKSLSKNDSQLNLISANLQPASARALGGCQF